MSEKKVPPLVMIITPGGDIPCRAINGTEKDTTEKTAASVVDGDVTESQSPPKAEQLADSTGEEQLKKAETGSAENGAKQETGAAQEQEAPTSSSLPDVVQHNKPSENRKRPAEDMAGPSEPKQAAIVKPDYEIPRPIIEDISNDDDDFPKVINVSDDSDDVSVEEEVDEEEIYEEEEDFEEEEVADEEEDVGAEDDSNGPVNVENFQPPSPLITYSVSDIEDEEEDA